MSLGYGMSNNRAGMEKLNRMTNRYRNINGIEGYGFPGLGVLQPELKRRLCQFGTHAIHKGSESVFP